MVVEDQMVEVLIRAKFDDIEILIGTLPNGEGNLNNEDKTSFESINKVNIGIKDIINGRIV